MEKKTKTILLAGMGALVLGGVGWYFLRPRKAKPLPAPEQLRANMQTALRQMAAERGQIGQILALRKQGGGRALPAPPPLPQQR